MLKFLTNLYIIITKSLFHQAYVN